ncbi:MAG: hypothetical protein E7214_02900 [Clostridium sp.]|nr:hypothetical protein [Clostridium sp.]
MFDEIKIKNLVYLLTVIGLGGFAALFMSMGLMPLALACAACIGIEVMFFFNDKPLFILILMVLISDRFLNFVPLAFVVGGSNIQYAKLNILLFGLLSLYAIRDFLLGRIENKLSPFNLICMCPLLLAIMATYYTYSHYNQSLILGIFIQGEFLTLLTVIPINYLIKFTKRNYEIVKKTIMVISVIASVLYTVQYAVHGSGIVFLKMTSAVRYGELRLLLSGGVVIYGTFITVSYLLLERKPIYVFCILMQLFCIVVVLKTRMIIFGVGIGIALILAIDKNISKLKLIMIMVPVLAIGLTVSFNSLWEMYQLTKEEMTSNTGNYLARVNEKQFFLAQVENPLVGRGVITPKSEIGTQMEGSNENFYLNDIGITGFYVLYGLIGLAWYVALIVVLVIKSFMLCKKTKKGYEVFGYSVYLGTVITTLADAYYSPIYVVLSFVLLNMIEKSYVDEDSSIEEIDIAA